MKILTKNKALILAAVGVSLTIFTIRGIVFLDPDFGWHIRMGEIVSKSGIPKTDPLSYTMPSFHFVDHEWLTNFILYKLYYSLGNNFLALFFGVLAILALIMPFKVAWVNFPVFQKTSKKNSGVILFLVSVFIFSASTVLPYEGVRPQIQSWLLLSILVYILYDESRFNKFKYFLLPFSLLWSNLHGSFGAGIVTIAFVVLVRSFRKRKLTLVDFSIVLGCVFFSLINPYGTGIWRELWMQVSDTKLRWRIIEWMPSFLTANMSYAILISLSLAVLWIYRKKFLLEEKLLFLAFLFQALGSTRHVPLWLVVSLPFILKGFGWFLEEISKTKFGLERFNKVAKVVFVVSLIVALFTIFFEMKDLHKLSEGAYYPKEAVVYLSSNLPQGEIFSGYGWGGYLNWKLPQKRVFIDGRMPSWRWNVNKEKESNNIMPEFLDIAAGVVDFEPFVKKYGIELVLWQNSENPKFIEIERDWLRKLVQKLYGKKESKNFIDEIKKAGWQEVYKDDVAVIYKKLHN